jgi:peptidoglycan/xylan/chitin deacetylase (PgdA/CDA1 family)
MKEIKYDVFRDGKRSCVTFSYDDGKINDIRLSELFVKYGLKATFNLNSNNLDKPTYITKEDVKKLSDSGFEIAVHTVSHPFLENLSESVMFTEIYEDKKNLESITGKLITGMAYPFGTYSQKVKEIAKSCGIDYARTTQYNGYRVPADFLEWHGACHHRDLSKFKVESHWYCNILYVWGHSYEFDTEEKWQEFEENLKRISNKEDVWYATNGEICEYVLAQRNLKFFADYSKCYNPSATDVWILVDFKPVKIPAGETVEI